MANTIWGTAEASAWSRDFDYVDYLHLCAENSVKPVSVQAYDLLCKALHQAMQDDPEFHPLQVGRLEIDKPNN